MLSTSAPPSARTSIRQPEASAGAEAPARFLENEEHFRNVRFSRRQFHCACHRPRTQAASLRRTQRRRATLQGNGHPRCSARRKSGGGVLAYMNKNEELKEVLKSEFGIDDFEASIIMGGDEVILKNAAMAPLAMRASNPPLQPSPARMLQKRWRVPSWVSSNTACRTTTLPSKAGRRRR